MNINWLNYLTAHGATVSDSRVLDFGNSPAELSATADDNVLVDLSYLGLLGLVGEDCATFLQGQVTSDVCLLTGGNSQYAGYCTAKGRLFATLLLWKQGDAYFAQLDGGITPAVMKRLSMYVLRSKVKIADAGDKLVRIGIAGADSIKALAAAFPDIPQQPHQLVMHENATLLRLPGSAPRFECIAAPDTASTLWEQLAQDCKPVGAPCWEWLDIRAGIPQVSAATQEEFVPQMLNLDLLDGINFSKGCYTGQEIVARTHYLGKVKRRTQLAHVEGTEPPKPGDMVYGTNSTESVGMVVNAAPARSGGFDLLAEIRLESLEAGTLHWKAQDGPTLQLLALPYGFPD